MARKRAIDPVEAAFVDFMKNYMALSSEQQKQFERRLFDEEGLFSKQKFELWCSEFISRARLIAFERRNDGRGRPSDPALVEPCLAIVADWEADMSLSRLLEKHKDVDCTTINGIRKRIKSGYDYLKTGISIACSVRKGMTLKRIARVHSISSIEEVENRYQRTMQYLREEFPRSVRGDLKKMIAECPEVMGMSQTDKNNVQN